MKDGAAGLDEMSKKAEELGIVVSSDDVKAAAELGDTMDIFHMSLSALQTTIGARLAPVIKRVVERLEDVIGRNKELISQKIAEAVQAFSDALERVPWDTVITVISSVISAFGWVFNAIGGCGHRAFYHERRPACQRAEWGESRFYGVFRAPGASYRGGCCRGCVFGDCNLSALGCHFGETAHTRRKIL